MKKKVGIIGATGYAGIELVRILLSHRQVELAAVSSVSFEGKPISEIYPSLYAICDLTLQNDEKVIEQCDVVFASLPHGLSQQIAKQCDEKGKLFIDLGADFRLKEEETYQTWYHGNFEDKALHQKAQYGLCELFREEIKKTNIIANPGCYPTSVALGLAPALKTGLLKNDTIVIDSKSGATGAGRGLTLGSHYAEVNEAFAPYKIAAHRHTPEIEQTLSILAGSPVAITFVPHLLPLNRGIISTMYATLQHKITLEDIHNVYSSFYQNETFVRVLPLGGIANLKNVKLSNFCDISLHLDEHTNRLIIVSTLDNMVKGAAGQAVQNMNILCGFAEEEGLTFLPPAF